jgi:hypothetical protein
MHVHGSFPWKPHEYDQEQLNGKVRKFGRTGFRRNFRFDQNRYGRHYHTKQIEAYAVQEGTDWLVITVITRYF